MRLYFLASLLVHLALLGISLHSGKFAPKATSPLVSGGKIKVRTLSEKDLSAELKRALEADEKQIVQTDDRNRSESPPETDEKVFLSKFHQRVDRNTRAATHGKFRNSSDLTGPTSRTSSADPMTAKSKSSPAAGAGVAKLFQLGKNPHEAPVDASAAPSGRLLTPGRAPASLPGTGPSMTDDYLKDVAIGAQTLLNAQEYKFYSFYERVRTRLTEQWNLELRAQIEKVLKAGSGLGGVDRVTKVVVYLDKHGRLESTKIIATSGLSELDFAATEAFRISAPFPNPPKDMLQENELIPLRWDFVVVSNAADGIDIQIKREKFEGY